LTGIEKGDAIILPQFITLSDNAGYYMSVDPLNIPGAAVLETDSPIASLLVNTMPMLLSRGFLRCNKPEPDANCTFEVIHLSDGRISLKGAYGSVINQKGSSVNDTWFCCSGGNDHGAPFNVIRVKDNQIYLHATTAMGSFMTSRQHSNKNGVAGSTFAGTECLFTVSEPVASKKKIISIDYDLAKALMWDVPPLIALNTTVRNDSKTSDVQQTLAYSYQRSKVGSWNNAAGIEIGAETSFSSGVPFIASADFKVSVTSSSAHQWGASEGIEETVTSSTQITVPPGKKGKATVLVKKKAIDVPFRCKEKVMYKNGKTEFKDKDGVYHNVESYAVDVQAGDWEDV